MRMRGVALTAIVVSLAALAAMSRGADPQSTRQQRALAIVAVATRIGDDNVGSAGVVIDPARGLVLTSARAVWGATSVKVGTGLAVVFGRIVARDPCDGIAVVAVEPWLPGLASLPVRRDAPSGLPARVVARPWSDRPRRSRPLLSVPTVTEASGARLTVPVPLPEYAAGAAVLDERGRLLGVVTASTGPRSLVLPWSRVDERLARLRPGPGTLFVGWQDHYRCAPRLDAQARAEHPGYSSADARLNRPVPPTRLPGTRDLDQ